MDDSTRQNALQKGSLISLSAAEEILHRGGSCALNVQISFDGDHDCLVTVREALLGILAPHAHRMVELDIINDWRIYMAAFLRILGPNFPRLKRLRMVEYTCDYTPPVSQVDIDAKFTAPLLQYLEIDVGAPFYEAFWANTFLPNLQHLRLVGYELPNICAALRLCPILIEVHVDMDGFDYEVELGDDVAGFGSRRYPLRHLEIFNLGSDTWFDSRSEDLRKLVLQSSRPSTSVTMSKMSRSKHQASNYNTPTDIFASLYPPDDASGAFYSSTVLSLEAGIEITGEWSLNYDPQMRFVCVRAQTAINGTPYNPLRDRQRALSIPDDKESSMNLSVIWRHINCSCVTSLTIHACDWAKLHLPLPKTIPAAAELPEVANLHFPQLTLLQVGVFLRRKLGDGGSAHGLQSVAWNKFVPSVCEITVRHYITGGDDERKVVGRAWRYSDLSTFEAWIGGDADVGEDIPQSRWYG